MDFCMVFEEMSKGLPQGILAGSQKKVLVLPYRIRRGIPKGHPRGIPKGIPKPIPKGVLRRILRGMHARTPFKGFLEGS